METLFYFFKASLVLALFYAIYRLFLERETFYSLNRYFLIIGVLGSFILPFIIFTTTVYVDPLPSDALVFDSSLAQNLVNKGSAVEEMDWWQIGLYIYSIGILVMFIRFGFQLRSLLVFLKKENILKKNGFNYVESTTIEAPFSFFNYIAYNSEKHNAEDLELILEHERAHAKQAHTVDVLLAQVLVIFHWANPFSWLYKLSIEQNLEYMADHQATSQISNSKTYQLTLVKVMTAGKTPALVNTFYHSFIKKRIVMLNKQTSHNYNKWKTLLILPVIAAFLWSFNVKEEVKFKKSTSAFSNSETEEEPIFLLTPTSSDETIMVMENYFTENHPDLNINIEVVKRNASGRIMALNFETKFKNDQRFFKRFSRDENSPTNYLGYAFQYKAGPQLWVKELEDEGTQIMINQESLQIILSKESGLGQNPALIDRDSILGRLGRDIDSVSTLKTVRELPKAEAISKYGSQAEDGALVLEESNKNSKNVMNYQGKSFRVTIKKTMTSDEIDALVNNLESNYDISLKVSKLGYTDDKIINRISLKMKDNLNGNTNNYSLSDTDGIEDIILFRTEEGTTGFTSGRSSSRTGKLDSEEYEQRIKERKAQMEARREQAEATREQRELEMEKRMEEMDARRAEVTQELKEREEELTNERQKELTEAQMEISEEMQERREAIIAKQKERRLIIEEERQNRNDNFEYETRIKNKRTTELTEDLKDDMLYVVDGKISNAKKVNKIKPETIESINILKGESAYAAFGKKAEGKKGAVLIKIKE